LSDRLKRTLNIVRPPARSRKPQAPLRGRPNRVDGPPTLSLPVQRANHPVRAAWERAG